MVMSDKILTILDLDETLIHATASPPDDNWSLSSIKYFVQRIEMM